MSIPSLTVHVGDSLETLRTMPDGSVGCIVTSPPYWGLRDYGVDGQIGLEPTPAEFLARLVAVFNEARRVLADDGTCWVNMGDSYAGSWGAQSREGYSDASSKLEGGSPLSARQIKAHPKGTNTGSLKNTPGLKPKDLCGMPWRLAFALQDSGWWLRQDIIWHKPNPMPESIYGRCTKAHEMIFLFTKSGKPTGWGVNRDTRDVAFEPDWTIKVERNGKLVPLWIKLDYYFNAKAIAEPSSDPRQQDSDRRPHGWAGGKGGRSVLEHNAGSRDEYREKSLGGRNSFKRANSKRGVAHVNQNMGTHRPDRDDTAYDGPTRNARSVWTIPTYGCKEAHFATFPPEIPRRCILAGCKPGAAVLDPFAGSGTTLKVAIELGHPAIGIELNPEYAKLIHKRCKTTAAQRQLFTGAA